MFQQLTKFVGAALAGLAIAFPGFAADRPMQKERPAAGTGKTEACVEDSVITAKVKAALLRALELKSHDAEEGCAGGALTDSTSEELSGLLPKSLMNR